MEAIKQAGEVRLERDGPLCIITVDNAAKKNAFSPEMMDQLARHLTAFEEDDSLWVAVLCAAGEHTTAGLDMPKFFGPDATAKPRPDAWVDPFGLKRRTTKPVIAVVQGITFTIGIEIMLACDIVVAADTARFGQLESRRGIAPLGGAHFRYLTRTGWGNAMYHLFLCEEFGAQRALELGFVQEVVPYGQHIERALDLARRICRNAPLGIRATKQAALAYLEDGEQAAIACIPEIRAKVFASEDFKEGIQSFIERRDARFQGR
ncbi:crotonase/enoyl-CoA hydratase family protein [Bordetella bronchiseptica]|uniref:crotonase/enoyl-CoA hydratase family protein n=1 Tax=Bordetella bronchiseptica TaxID=518 RepID=UPI000460D159|nr:crotonase/enoyl-CoA hydratase family protein [Bordetella bronchiseptica]AWP78787.1 enoyl-CoA hydratase [Bordetella bronchiseptica]KDC36110.1 enoyl-CoA hydratase/isomerase family protein [Bordetella bronchiseptica M435/02/3]KDC87711.1 enoyl-CoA hydratase/isomerase family protein [Bordetella bronchiseptica MBORD668]KDC88245.1 enoyl-CoA hydratase/isomerase family protein [Bordetella bronchiseptica MBORD665]KDD04184.1 enoyl-CoA hydratase/isomerase family protein [Bordetella bronchiseptica MBORD